MEETTRRILATLIQRSRGSFLSGDDLATFTGLSPEDINAAVTILVESGFAEWDRYQGTEPYVFGGLQITPRGKYELERGQTSQASAQDDRGAIRPPVPVGSPYGFRDEDWEIVSERRSDSSVLNVVLGYQFESEYYDSDELQRNVEGMFLEAVNKYNGLPGSTPTRLQYQSLVAGYGEHLFNEIARDIISADIAVFDTSDLNPNVMLELGVALTWGVRVLPIKAEGCPRPPADISGQTWADYRESARVFVDPDHHQKLVRIVERAIRKKGHV